MQAYLVTCDAHRGVCWSECQVERGLKAAGTVLPRVVEKSLHIGMGSHSQAANCGSCSKVMSRKCLLKLARYWRLADDYSPLQSITVEGRKECYY